MGRSPYHYYEHYYCSAAACSPRSYFKRSCCSKDSTQSHSHLNQSLLLMYYSTLGMPPDSASWSRSGVALHSQRSHCYCLQGLCDRFVMFQHRRLWYLTQISEPATDCSSLITIHWDIWYCSWFFLPVFCPRSWLWTISFDPLWILLNSFKLKFKLLCLMNQFETIHLAGYHQQRVYCLHLCSASWIVCLQTNLSHSGCEGQTSLFRFFYRAPYLFSLWKGSNHSLEHRAKLRRPKYRRGVLHTPPSKLFPEPYRKEYRKTFWSFYHLECMSRTQSQLAWHCCDRLEVCFLV